MKEVVVGEKGREVMGEGHAGPRGWALPECIREWVYGFHAVPEKAHSGYRIKNRQ